MDKDETGAPKVGYAACKQPDCGAVVKYANGNAAVKAHASGHGFKPPPAVTSTDRTLAAVGLFKGATSRTDCGRPFQSLSQEERIWAGSNLLGQDFAGHRKKNVKIRNFAV